MPSQDQQENVLSSTPSLSYAIFRALFGLPFVGIGLFLVGNPLMAAITGHIQALIFIPVSAPFLWAGGWLYWWPAYKEFRRWRFYGTSHLQLEHVPVTLGSSLRARLRAPIPGDDQPPDDFHVRVAALKRSKRTSGVDVKWEDQTNVRGQPGTGETEVPFSLDLPVCPLPDDEIQAAQNISFTSVKSKLEGRLDWTVEVTASFDDKPDYEASFEFPVSAPDDLEEHIPDDSSGGGYIANR